MFEMRDYFVNRSRNIVLASCDHANSAKWSRGWIEIDRMDREQPDAGR